MRVFWALFHKDCLRLVRNPVPVLIFILIPFMISGLIGMAFGHLSDGSTDGMAAIKVGVVDEDDTVLSQFLRGSAGQEEFRQRFDVRFLEREEALQMVGQGELSAVLIIPEGFGMAYLEAQENIAITLVKNPAESVYPVIVQEGLEVLVTTLNAVSRTYGKDLKAWIDLLDEDRESNMLDDLATVALLLNEAVHQFEAARDYLTPPLVVYTRDKEDDADAEGDSGGELFNLFVFVLIGMAAMFLLMLADNCMRDLYREERFQTLRRYRTFRQSMFMFVVGKMAYAQIVLACAAILIFGLGAGIFQFMWKNPLHLVLMVLCYNVFAAGLLGFLTALSGKERRADVLNNVFIMVISLVGGAMWPAEQLPTAIRDTVTQFVPTYWFSSAVRALQFDYPGMHWGIAALWLVGLGILFTFGATVLFQRRLERGIQA